MKASRFSEVQKAFAHKQGADGMPMADICRKAGISQADLPHWKEKYDGLLPSKMRRLSEKERARDVLNDANVPKLSEIHEPTLSY